MRSVRVWLVPLVIMAAIAAAAQGGRHESDPGRPTVRVAVAGPAMAVGDNRLFDHGLAAPPEAGARGPAPSPAPIAELEAGCLARTLERCIAWDNREAAVDDLVRRAFPEDYDFWRCIVRRESADNPSAIGAAGEIGLGQVLYESHARRVAALGYGKEALHNPNVNLMVMRVIAEENGAGVRLDSRAWTTAAGCK